MILRWKNESWFGRNSFWCEWTHRCLSVSEQNSILISSFLLPSCPVFATLDLKGNNRFSFTVFFLLLSLSPEQLLSVLTYSSSSSQAFLSMFILRSWPQNCKNDKMKWHEDGHLWWYSTIFISKQIRYVLLIRNLLTDKRDWITQDISLRALSFLPSLIPVSHHPLI